MTQVPQLTQCCCGCSLRTGTKFVAWFGVITGCLELLNYLSGESGNLDEEGEKTRKFTATKTFLSVVRVIFSILLLQGAYKNKPNLYVPWIISSLIILGIESILIFISILLELSGVITIALMISVGIFVYFILVVYSDYREEMQKDQGQTV